MSEMVRRHVSEIPRATEDDLARLRAAADGPIDYSGIPEWVGPIRRVQRDAEGRIIPRAKTP